MCSGHFFSFFAVHRRHLCILDHSVIHSDLLVIKSGGLSKEIRYTLRGGSSIRNVFHLISVVAYYRKREHSLLEHFLSN